MQLGMGLVLMPAERPRRTGPTEPFGSFTEATLPLVVSTVVPTKIKAWADDREEVSVMRSPLASMSIV